MQSRTEYATLKVRNGRIECPRCRRLTSQVVRPDTAAKNLQVYCRSCKWVGVVNIDSGQCSTSSPC